MGADGLFLAIHAMNMHIEYVGIENAFGRSG